MHERIKQMLAKYDCMSGKDYRSALKEIIQEIALFGLWRSKFFEHAAFYGGTALRILYGLDRFSEDLDFSLLQPQEGFNLRKYEASLINEIQSFGLRVEVETKLKSSETTVQSAFIKANTLIHLLKVEVPKDIQKTVQAEEKLKIKFELETDPIPGFETESKVLTQPLPFTVRSYKLPYLFAGKMHALLCRDWGRRVKGRDWYDFVWFIGRDVPVATNYLEQKMRASDHWTREESLTIESLSELVCDQANKMDLRRAQEDVIRFVNDPRSIEVWSPEFFVQLAQQLRPHVEKS